MPYQACAKPQGAKPSCYNYVENRVFYLRTNILQYIFLLILYIILEFDTITYKSFAQNKFLIRAGAQNYNSGSKCHVL